MKDYSGTDNQKDVSHENIFHTESHIDYFKTCLKILPSYYVGLDTTRLTAIYFCTLGLDILGYNLVGEERDSVINFIYSNQLNTGSSEKLLINSSNNSLGRSKFSHVDYIDNNLNGRNAGHCGFIGSSFCGQPFLECCRYLYT